MTLKEKALNEYNKTLGEIQLIREQEYQLNTTITKDLFITAFQTHPDLVTGHRVEVEGMKFYREGEDWVLMGYCLLCGTYVESKLFRTLSELGELLTNFQATPNHKEECIMKEIELIRKK